MPFVLLDTNALITDYLFEQAHVRTFFAGCERCNIARFIPEIVVDELVGNYEKHVRKSHASYCSYASKLRQVGIAVEASEIDIAKEVGEYREYVRRTIDRHGFGLVPYPDLPLKELVAASYAAKKPFKDSGEGFKDFLVFQAVRLCAHRYYTGWFISGNHKDFGHGPDNLHDELVAQLPEDSHVVLVASISEFNRAFLMPELEKLDGIAKQLRDGKFDGFNLTDDLTNVFIKELCKKYRPITGIDTPLDEPTAESVGEPDVQELTVSRLDDELLVFQIEGEIGLELDGFIAKRDWYALSDEDLDDIYISDHDWNEWVVRASVTRTVEFQMTILFSEGKREIDSTSIEFGQTDPAGR